MKITKLAIAVGAAMCLSATVANAGEKYDFLCSPGYFKNHTEVWSSWVDEATFQALMEGLTATGAHNGDLKQDAAAYINSIWMMDGKLERPCEDGDPVGGDD